MATTPTYNTQFGQKIGVDDTAPPKAARGPRPAEESRFVDDPNQVGRVRFAGKPKRPPPPEEASAAAEAGVRDDAGPEEFSDMPEKTSVWDAREDDSEREAPAKGSR